jgi:hypothetical protein
MSNPDYVTLKGINNINESLLSIQLESNLKSFYDWGLLNIGAFFNVSGTTSGVYGGDFNKLRRVDDPIYSVGQVWESARKDWVWETGVQFTGSSPIEITGVSINGTGVSTSGTFSHYFNYQLGRVVFNSGIPTGVAVKVDHSYRWVQVCLANDSKWWKELQFQSFRPEDSHFVQQVSGSWSIGSQHRVQLPAIVLETVPRGDSRGYQLGDGALHFNQDVVFHVVAETKWARDQLVDILALQSERTIKLYDVDKVSRSGVYGLDYRGMTNPSGLTYPQLIEDYSWNDYKCFFTHAIKSQVDNHSNELYEGTVRVTCRVVMDDL